MFKISFSILLAGLALHPTAEAAINWDFAPPTGTSPIYANYSGTKATVSAFASNSSNTSSSFSAATANSYGNGGVGIAKNGESSNSPHHAVDNNNGFEFALFTFTDIATGVNVAATLNSLAIGWKDTDADVSVLAYTGTGIPTVSGKSTNGLLSSGWSLVAHLSNMATGDSNAKSFNNNVNTALNTSSSYWLVGGYYGSNVYSSGNLVLNAGDDYFKISGLGGTFTPPPGTSNDPVPEPSSLVMLSFALLGWRRYRAGYRYSMAF